MTEPAEGLQALVRAANLVGVSFIELSAVRTGGTAPTEEITVDPKFTLRIEVHPSDPRFQLRLRVEIDTAAGAIAAETSAEYDVSDLADRELLEQPLLLAYANEVGIMVLLPFLRQAIADMTQRVFNAPLLMPIMPRGAVAFTDSDFE